MICISLYFRFLLQIMGQTWVKTIAHTATLTLLPILTYVITSVISGNIALSLGMVGALSIVRFRNPVRSPLELSLYFGAITIGITAAVSLKWLLLLVGSVTLVAIVLYEIQKLSKIFTDKPFFITSFSEGNSLSTLQVVSKTDIPKLDKHEKLVSKLVNEGKETSYTLASNNFDQLKIIEEEIRSTDGLLTLQVNK